MACVLFWGQYDEEFTTTANVVTAVRLSEWGVEEYRKMMKDAHHRVCFLNKSFI